MATEASDTPAKLAAVMGAQQLLASAKQVIAGLDEPIGPPSVVPDGIRPQQWTATFSIKPDSPPKLKIGIKFTDKLDCGECPWQISPALLPIASAIGLRDFLNKHFPKETP